MTALNCDKNFFLYSVTKIWYILVQSYTLMEAKQSSNAIKLYELFMCLHVMPKFWNINFMKLSFNFSKLLQFFKIDATYIFQYCSWQNLKKKMTMCMTDLFARTTPAFPLAFWAYYTVRLCKNDNYLIFYYKWSITLFTDHWWVIFIFQ